MLSSPKNFLIGAGMIGMGTALTIATGGAILPFMVSTGVIGGAIQFGLNAYKAHNAKTDDEAKTAWQGIGAGTSAIGLSIAGSKSALKGAKINTEGLNPLTATLECLKQAPSSVSKSIKAFTSGEFLINFGIKARLEIKSKNEPKAKEPVKKPVQETAQETPIKASPIKTELELIEQEEAAVRAQFMADMKDKIPPYEERYTQLRDGIKAAQPNLDCEKYAARLAEEETYLSGLWKSSDMGKEFFARKTLAKMDEQNLALFNKAKSALKANGIECSDAELLKMREFWRTNPNESLCTEYGAVYGHGSAYGYNRLLRAEGAKGNEGGLWQQILDKGFQNVKPLEEDVTVYRGIMGNKNNSSFEYVKNLLGRKKGEVLPPDKGYMYSSFNKDVANTFTESRFGNSVLLEIKVPKGAKVSSAKGSAQSEMLFPRNTQFRILEEAKEVNGIMQMAVEYVMPEK